MKTPNKLPMGWILYNESTLLDEANIDGEMGSAVLQCLCQIHGEWEINAFWLSNFKVRQNLRDWEADELGNIKTNIKKVLCEDVDWISVTLCVLQRKTLAIQVMTL